MPQAILRHWHTLRLLPRAPHKISTAMLRDRLADRGFAVDIRTVQRDLHNLSTCFPLVNDEPNRPLGWSWASGAQAFDVPGMDVHTALAFRLAEQYLNHLLPAVTTEYLSPHIQRARTVLNEVGQSGVPGWVDKVRVVPGGLPMAPPRVQQAVLEVVHEALLRGRRLELSYRPRGASEPKGYLVSPHALVYRESIAYLVVSVREYDDILQFALHRVVSATLLDTPIRKPASFSLDDYIAAGEFGFLVGTAPLALVARLHANAAVRLQETPLSADQTLTPLSEHHLELRGTVADTTQLRTWIKGHGALCEVIGPASLRAELAAEAAEMCRNYGL